MAHASMGAPAIGSSFGKRWSASRARGRVPRPRIRQGKPRRSARWNRSSCPNRGSLLEAPTGWLFFAMTIFNWSRGATSRDASTRFTVQPAVGGAGTLPRVRGNGAISPQTGCSPGVNFARCGEAGWMFEGAPSFELFGAFFPAWMLCAGVGIACSIVARALLTKPRLQVVVPHQLMVCTALGVIGALIFWLAIFR